MSLTKQIRVMLADDHPIMRDALQPCMRGTLRLSDWRETGLRR